MKRLFCLVVVAGASIAACNNNETTPTPVVASVTITAAIEGQSGTSAVRSIPVSVAAVSVKPTPDSVAVGKTVTLKATPTRANGDTLTAKKMFWASSDTSVAIVSSNDSLGVSPGNTATIKGVKVGSVTITATISGVSGTAAMKVLP